MHDTTLQRAFESCALPIEQWGHAEHLRIAFLYLSADSFEQALARLRKAICAYNAHHGVPDELTSGYHETLTVAWLRLIDARRMTARDSCDSRAFLERNSDLLSKTMLRRYYSTEQIVTWHAKRRFVPADLQPLPTSSLNETPPTR